MRRFQLVACLVLAAVLLQGCIWTQVVVVAEPAIRAGVAEGVEYANEDLTLELDAETRGRITDRVTERVMDELRKLGEEPAPVE